MRKLMLAAVLAALGAALLATSASAFDPHFTVRQKYKASHQLGPKAFVRKDMLVDPHDRQVRVGRDRWRCRARSHPYKLRCKAFIHLNGRIGGKGAIRVRGNLRHNGDYVTVLGGSCQFDGVAGKMSWRGYRLHFDLVH